MRSQTTRYACPKRLGVSAPLDSVYRDPSIRYIVTLRFGMSMGNDTSSRKLSVQGDNKTAEQYVILVYAVGR